MNKQIEILSHELNKAWQRGYGDLEHHVKCSIFDSVVEAEALYNRIAPLREFPEDAVRILISRSRLRNVAVENNALNAYTFGEILDGFKRLWEGAGSEEDKALTGGCPTCGGSGEILPSKFSSFVEPCPDCERRKVKRRVESRRMVNELARRNGKDRREDPNAK